MTSTPTVEHPPLDRGTAPLVVDVPRKSVLFCPCGREAPSDAWSAEPVGPAARDGDRTRLVCPDCGGTLTVR
jgi:hypothetical protein